MLQFKYNSITNDHLELCSDRDIGGGGSLLHAHNLPDGPPELCGHQAVEQEVCRAVEESQQVHHLPHRVVALHEELLAKDGREQAKDTLPRGRVQCKGAEDKEALQEENVRVRKEGQG